MQHLFLDLFADNRVVREVFNGVWFVLSVEMLLALLWFLVASIREPQVARPTRIVLVPMCWYERPEVQLAIAWTVYITGSAMRAGWIWVLLECQNRTKTPCSVVAQHYGFMMIAVALASIGGLCSMRIMLPERWAPWSWIVPGLVAFAIPVAYHWGAWL